MEGSGLSGWLAGRSGIRTERPSGVSTTVESGYTYSVGGGAVSSSRSVVCVSGGEAGLNLKSSSCCSSSSSSSSTSHGSGTAAGGDSKVVIGC